MLSASKVKRIYQEGDLQLPNPAVSHPQKCCCHSFTFISFEPYFSLCLSGTPGFSLQPTSLQETSFATNFEWVILPSPSKPLPERCSAWLPISHQVLLVFLRNVMHLFLEFITMPITWLVPGRLCDSSDRGLALLQYLLLCP